jgi:hypothetical protein
VQIRGWLVNPYVAAKGGVTTGHRHGRRPLGVILFVGLGSEKHRAEMICAPSTFF